MRRLAALLLALAVSGCGGDGGGPDYGTTLESGAPQLANALDAAVEPCLAQDLPACERLLEEARDSATALFMALVDAEPPDELAAAHAQLTGGLDRLRAALQHGIDEAAAGNDDELADVRTEIHDASVDVNNAFGEIAEELDLDLPTV
ncbi:MAG: hypothetical protein WD689_09530 [Gaiellaceae bacterium]